MNRAGAALAFLQWPTNAFAGVLRFPFAEPELHA